MSRAVFGVVGVWFVVLVSYPVAEQRPAPDYFLDVAARGLVPLDESMLLPGVRNRQGGEGDSRALGKPLCCAFPVDGVLSTLGVQSV
jgi:hypothetical protein